MKKIPYDVESSLTFLDEELSISVVTNTLFHLSIKVYKDSVTIVNTAVEVPKPCEGLTLSINIPIEYVSGEFALTVMGIEGKGFDGVRMYQENIALGKDGTKYLCEFAGRNNPTPRQSIKTLMATLEEIYNNNKKRDDLTCQKF